MCESQTVFAWRSDWATSTITAATFPSRIEWNGAIFLGRPISMDGSVEQL